MTSNAEKERIIRAYPGYWAWVFRANRAIDQARQRDGTTDRLRDAQARVAAIASMLSEMDAQLDAAIVRGRAGVYYDPGGMPPLTPFAFLSPALTARTVYWQTDWPQSAAAFKAKDPDLRGLAGLAGVVGYDENGSELHGDIDAGGEGLGVWWFIPAMLIVLAAALAASFYVVALGVEKAIGAFEGLFADLALIPGQSAGVNVAAWVALGLGLWALFTFAPFGRRRARA